jgi:hypothetical protein
MAHELRWVFNKYENTFHMNEIGTSDPPTADHIRLKASVLRQYIGDAVLEAIDPVGTDRTKTYEEIKKAIEDKFRPAYSDNLVRAQFLRITMADGMSSRNFLHSLWAGIRRTGCKDEQEQLAWVLTCFTTRHVNVELRRAFELKPPMTEAEALQMVDDIESKQHDRTANRRVKAGLQESQPLQANEVANVDYNRQNNNARG